MPSVTKAEYIKLQYQSDNPIEVSDCKSTKPPLKCSACYIQ